MESRIFNLKSDFRKLETTASEHLKAEKKQLVVESADMFASIPGDQVSLPAHLILRPQFLAAEQNSRQIVRKGKKELASKTKQEVILEQEKIARIVSLLYEKVADADPKTSSVEVLLEFVESYEGIENLPEQVKFLLVKAIEGFDKKRAIVKKNSHEFKNPAEFFEKCFGKKPKGQVEIIPGAMTICFRCFEEEDYIFAFTHSKQNVPQGLDQELEKAKESGGAALGTVLIPDLAGVVTLEKVSNNKMETKIEHQRRVEIPILYEGRKQRIPYTSNTDTIYFWQIKGEDIMIVVKMYDTGSRTAKIIDQEGRIVGELSDYDRHTKRVDIGFGDNSSEFVEIGMSTDGLVLDGKVRTKSFVKYTEVEGKKWVVKNKDSSKKIRVHEEQHQLNKLFVPEEGVLPEGYKDFFVDKLTEARIGSVEVKRQILHRLATMYRQIAIDPRARDEILAYYKDGRPTEEILKILRESSLYRYQDENIKLQSGNIVTLQEFFRIRVESGAAGVNKFSVLPIYNANGSFKEEIAVNKLVVPFSLEEVNLEVKRVFENDYFGYKYKTQDGQEKFNPGALGMWVAQVKKMEDMGYDRKTIVAFLSTLPANRWRSYVNRLKAKSK